MTSVLDVIAQAYHDSRCYWQHVDSRPEDALRIVNELVAHGLAVDSETGARSLEHRALAAIQDEYDTYEHITRESVAVRVALALNLATFTECVEWSGEVPA